MSGRGQRSFHYGARLTVTVPLAAVFMAAASEMVVLALSASFYWRIAFVIIASLTILFALAMVREVLVRVRGKRKIVIAARTLIMPGVDRGGAVVTIPYRDIRKLELVGAGGGFKRVLKIGHTHGELEISGVMLGSVGELDEIHGLIKAARKMR
jgi:hypothetical protein